MSRRDRKSDPEGLIRSMLKARRRHQIAFVATKAALEVLTARIDRWRRGEIEISNIATRPACSLGRDSREESVELLAALLDERRSTAKAGLFARRRARHRLASLLVESAPPRDLLQDLEAAALAAATGLARRRMAARRRIFEKWRNLVVESHLEVVDRMVGRYGGTPLSREDLLQEGRAGLMRAVESFDPGPGSPFGAYARFWVRHAMLDALARSTRLIRLPHWLNAAVSRRARGLDDDKESTPVVPPRVQALDDDAGRALPIADEKCCESVDAAAGRELVELALAGLSVLTPRDREIVVARYGLEGREVESRGALARRLGLSAQRIGQIEREALERLRRELSETAGA